MVELSGSFTHPGEVFLGDPAPAGVPGECLTFFEFFGWNTALPPTAPMTSRATTTGIITLGFRHQARAPLGVGEPEGGNPAIPLKAGFLRCSAKAASFAVRPAL